jgi:lipopolysaccharide transport system ATP-binding protein
MITLMLGMDVEATGYENIRLQAVLFGMSDREIDRKKDEIAEFTELGEYLSMPLRTYSSGMMMRIAFGVATSLAAEIILMDEWLSVGDAHFIDKADRRLNEFVAEPYPDLASHAPDLLRKTQQGAIANMGVSGRWAISRKY